MEKVILILSCILAVIADMSLVWWAKHPKHPTLYMAIGVILGMSALGIWAFSMRRGIESAMAITTYSLLTVAGCSFLGIVVFKEALTAVNATGMILAFIALILISL